MMLNKDGEGVRKVNCKEKCNLLFYGSTRVGASAAIDTSAVLLSCTKFDFPYIPNAGSQLMLAVLRASSAIKFEHSHAQVDNRSLAIFYGDFSRKDSFRGVL